MHAPPGTALYHERNEGWTVTDHLLTDALEILDWLAWTKTTDAQEKIREEEAEATAAARHQKAAKKSCRTGADKPMTVAEYVAKTGMVIQSGRTGLT